MKAIYQLKDLEKEVGNFRLKIADCCLEEGGIYAICGPNGCGKTTLLNMLAFLDKPDSGKIFFRSILVEAKASNYRQQIAYLLQAPYLFNLRVYDNIACALRFKNLAESEIKERVNRMLERFALTKLKQRFPDQLSGGECQRVALARTFVTDSAVYLLDEPIANVDRSNMAVVEKLILALNQEKKATLIFTSHSNQQAYRMSKKIISLINGEIKDIAYENVFSGNLEEELDGLKVITINEKLRLQLSQGQPGPATVAIDPQDILLSNQPLDSSALNKLKGTISKLEEVNGSLRIFIDLGAELCALITKRSYHDLGLNIGKTVWATFKANSIKVL